MQSGEANNQSRQVFPLSEITGNADHQPIGEGIYPSEGPGEVRKPELNQEKVEESEVGMGIGIGSFANLFGF